MGMITYFCNKMGHKRIWWYVNFYTITEGKVSFTDLVTYKLFAKYIKGRFTVVRTMFINIWVKSFTFSTFSLAGIIKLMVHLKICQ